MTKIVIETRAHAIVDLESTYIVTDERKWNELLETHSGDELAAFKEAKEESDIISHQNTNSFVDEVLTVHDQYLHID